MQSATLSMAGPWQNSMTRPRARLLRQKWRKCGRVGMTEDRVSPVLPQAGIHGPVTIRRRCLPVPHFHFSPAHRIYDRPRPLLHFGLYVLHADLVALSVGSKTEQR